ncbi:restriction endonuclease [Bdellovibrio sp.]|uniref:restriction endonuclease n=1 Tax=Bdellovibrio TaxID=958 RepID=UPI003221B080
MAYVLVVSILVALSVLAVFLSRRFFSADARAQRDLNKYLRSDLSFVEVGRLYERYIGHLYEKEGYDVVYNGALRGISDLGRDLVVGCVDEVFVIQVKCWAKYKEIKEKHIFELFGTTTHFKLTSEGAGRSVKAVFYTTARYSDGAKHVAKVLGVDLKTERLDRFYPMIKCSISADGKKLYYLPFDVNYDKIKINLHRDELFAQTVKEAVGKGFKRAG